MNAVTFQPGEDSFQCTLLAEPDIRVAIPIFNADNMVTYNGHSRAVSCELLVCTFGIILLRFNELVVKIQIVTLLLTLFSGSNERLDQQFVHCVSCIEVI